METYKLLQKYFEKKKKATNGFSIRSLAKRLDVSPSFLSRVLSGKKSIPYALLMQLGKALDIEPEVFSGLKQSHQTSLDEIPKRGKASIKTELQDWEMAAKDSHRLLRQWFYLPIMDLTSLSDFDGTLDMISRRLNLSKTSTEVAVRDLLSLGLLEIKEDRILKTKKKIRWGSSQSLNDIRCFHDLMLNKAKEELKNSTSEEDFQKRLITGITLTASPEKIENAKRKLAECLHEIANELTAEQGTEVYHLAAQLFPLTKSK